MTTSTTKPRSDKPRLNDDISDDFIAKSVGEVYQALDKGDYQVVPNSHKKSDRREHK